MSVDVDVEFFALDLFNSIWMASGLIDSYQAYGNSKYNEDIRKAVFCRQLVFRCFYSHRFSVDRDEFNDSPSDFNSYFRKSFSELDFGPLDVIDQTYNLCAFGAELSLYCAGSGNIIYRYSTPLCWAMYFDLTFKSKFFYKGGWDAFRKEAKSYLPLYDFFQGHGLEMETFNETLPFHKIFSCVRDRSQFLTSIDQDPDRSWLRRCVLDCHELLIDRLRSKMHELNAYGNVEVQKELEIIFNCLKFLCNPTGSGMVVRDEAIDQTPSKTDPNSTTKEFDFSGFLGRGNSAACNSPSGTQLKNSAKYPYVHVIQSVGSKGSEISVNTNKVIKSQTSQLSTFYSDCKILQDSLDQRLDSLIDATYAYPCSSEKSSSKGAGDTMKDSGPSEARSATIVASTGAIPKTSKTNTKKKPPKVHRETKPIAFEPRVEISYQKDTRDNIPSITRPPTNETIISDAIPKPTHGKTKKKRKKTKGQTSEENPVPQESGVDTSYREEINTVLKLFLVLGTQPDIASVLGPMKDNK